jgi:ATP-dependent exoDNAse (exonuclease V) beta subunit
VYSYAYHRPKLDFLRAGTLDEKRAKSAASSVRFAPIAEFLESVPTVCPHELFTRDEDPTARASQAHPAFADARRAVVSRKENAATETAALIIPAVGNNKLRHETLQRFMLANDSVTLAVEVPIWLTGDDIAAIEGRYGIHLAPGTGAPRAITGHLDFLQVRNGAVHILDYKPDARTTKPLAQLTIYALALARLTGITLFDIKCAWFNETEYCEFFLRVLLSHAHERNAA